MYRRIIPFDPGESCACFPWGPRQTGKSTLLAERFPSSLTYDLLRADEYRRLLADPTLVRQECEASAPRTSPGAAQCAADSRVFAP